MDRYPPAKDQRREYWPHDRFPEGDWCTYCEEELTVDEPYYADFDSNWEGTRTVATVAHVRCYEEARRELPTVPRIVLPHDPRHED
jgi:hypothetical protein